MNVSIVGGSLAGLMTGLELRAAGASVRIHERSERVLDDRGAGIVMQAETLQMLTEHCGLREEETGVWLRYRQYLGRDGRPESHQAMPQLMTSWGLLYRALRAAFPVSDYLEGDPLVSFDATAGAVKANFWKSGEVTADLLVAADGSRSLVRSRLFPEVRPQYAGYVAWRGVVKEKDADAGLLETFGDHFTFQQMRRSHILCYLIPGADGETTPGQRRLNWVWYWNVDEAELSGLMTGHGGRQHDFSVPPGDVRPEWLAQQDANARQVLCPQFLALWQATRKPFVQPILDLAVPRMVAGHVAVLGDAAFIPRPHTAASTSKAAANAIALGEAVRQRPADVAAALGLWEPQQLRLGRSLEARGKMLGERSQFSD